MPTASTRTQLVLAVIAAVFATLVTGALNTSPTARLVGAALGAATSVLATSGSAQGIMLSVLITGGALLFTYGGFTILDYASDKEPTFPIPSVMPLPAPTPNVTTTEDGLTLEWTPEKVTCDSDGCDEVTVTSTGEELVKIFNIEFVGDEAAEFGHDGDCENRDLDKDEECQISVIFTLSGAGSRTVKLRMHHNVGPDPTDITVEGTAGGGSPPPPEPALDLVPATDTAECAYQAGGALVDGQPTDALQITFTLQIEGV